MTRRFFTRLLGTAMLAATVALPKFEQPQRLAVIDPEVTYSQQTIWIQRRSVSDTLRDIVRSWRTGPGPLALDDTGQIVYFYR